MRYLWAKYDGSELVGVFRNAGDSAPFHSEECPITICCCLDGDFCIGAQLGIHERQQATAVIGEMFTHEYPGWSSGDPANPTRMIAHPCDNGKYDYTLDELKAYVNHLAQYYVDGSYSGGADPPTMITDWWPDCVYANSATDCQELIALIADMALCRPFSNGWAAWGDGADRKSGGSGGHSTAEAAYLAAVDAWSAAAVADNTHVAPRTRVSITESGTPSEFSVSVATQRGWAQWQNTRLARAKTLHAFGLFGAPGMSGINVWSGQGIFPGSVAAQSEYSRIMEPVMLPANMTSHDFYWGSHAVAPSVYSPSTPGSATNIGWRTTGGEFVLLEPDFVYCRPA